MIHEYCAYCEEEVVLHENTFGVHNCPHCGHAIVTCSLCTKDSCTGCIHEQLAEQINSNR